MKKFTSLLLTLAMLATLAIAAPAFADDVASAEPVEVTYYRNALSRNNITDWGAAAWMQEIQKRMNVNITFLGPQTGDDYNQAVNIMLASGDYADMVYMDWNNYNGGLSAAIEDGIVVNVSANEDYKALMPTWFGMLEGNESIQKAVTLDDGTSAMFCHVESTPKRGAYGGIAIRKDWLDRLGLEVPTTIDELHDVLVAFRDQDANGNGDASDEIPMTDDKGKELMNALAAAWGLRYENPYPNPDDPTQITYWTEYQDGAAFTDFVTTMRSWYEEGLIDIEFASQEGSAREAKITGNTAGTFFAYTGNYAQWTDSIIASNPDIDGEVYIYGMVPMVGPAGKPYGNNDAHVRFAASNEGTCITQTAIDDGSIEPLLKMIDYMYTDEGSEIINWGIEGVSYTKDEDGTHHWTDTVLNDPEFSFSDKVFEYALPTWGSWPKMMSYEAWASIELTTDASKNAHENYWKADTGLLIQTLMMNYEEAEEYNQIMTDAKTAISETWVSCILGTKSMDEIPKLLQTLDNMGVSRAMEIYQGVFDRFNSK